VNLNGQKEIPAKLDAMRLQFQRLRLRALRFWAGHAYMGKTATL
jgi:hypothetical protein